MLRLWCCLGTLHYHSYPTGGLGSNLAVLARSIITPYLTVTQSSAGRFCWRWRTATQACSETRGRRWQLYNFVYLLGDNVALRIHLGRSRVSRRDC